MKNLFWVLVAGFCLFSSFGQAADAPACPDGQIRTIPLPYREVQPGYFCPVSKEVCINMRICPQRMPPSPNFCPDGVIRVMTTYRELSNGYACPFPSIACVKEALCPEVAAPSPDFCKDGKVVQEQTGFTPAGGRYSCPVYRWLCVKQELCADPVP